MQVKVTETEADEDAILETCALTARSLVIATKDCKSTV